MHQLPDDVGVEVAFVGRSNAGKSSAINVVTQQKRLARTSKTPGRTQLINLFSLNEHCRLVDLPGYGYAKVSLAQKKAWNELIDKYLTQRQCLKGLVLIMDIRHPMKPFDQQILTWVATSKLPVHILLTKTDKLKRGAANAALKLVTQAVRDNERISVQLFSTPTQQGVEACRAQLDTWFTGA